MSAILGGLVGASHNIEPGRDGMVAPRSHRAGHQAKSDSLVKVSVKRNIMWLSKTSIMIRMSLTMVHAIIMNWNRRVVTDVITKRVERMRCIKLSAYLINVLVSPIAPTERWSSANAFHA